MATWRELLAAYSWRPIRGCPGRYVLAAHGPTEAPPDRAFGLGQVAHAFDSDAARDRVLVVALAEGGLISYQRADGRFVHTLNTPDGFARKLAQLGVEIKNSK